MQTARRTGRVRLRPTALVRGVRLQPDLELPYNGDPEERAVNADRLRARRARRRIDVTLGGAVTVDDLLAM